MDLNREDHKFRIFLVHSFEDLSLVKMVYEPFQDYQWIEVFVAEWEKRPGELLSGKIEDLIARSDVAIVIWTHNTEKSLMANQEVGYIKSLNKPVFPFLSKGMNLKGFLQGFEYIGFDPYNVEDDVKNLLRTVVSFARKMGFEH